MGAGWVLGIAVCVAVRGWVAVWVSRKSALLEKGWRRYVSQWRRIFLPPTALYLALISPPRFGELARKVAVEDKIEIGSADALILSAGVNWPATFA